MKTNAELYQEIKDNLAELARRAAAEIEKEAESAKASHPDWEARTGHYISSTDHDDWQCEDHVKWIVCPKSWGKIKKAVEYSSCITIIFEDGTSVDDDDVLFGNGETEAET